MQARTRAIYGSKLLVGPALDAKLIREKATSNSEHTDKKGISFCNLQEIPETIP